MDFITSNIKQLYRKYLVASMTSAMAMSIYSIVDAVAVGQSEGPIGTAAMAVINPLFGVLMFLSVLCGIGGSVMMNNSKGEGNDEKGNAYFTASLVLVGGLTLIVWLTFIFFHNTILTFFGADEALMPKLMEYAQWLIYPMPLFVLTPYFAAFVRNDGAPSRAMAAIIIGGCFNIFGDWFFVFPMGMGMSGAGLATAIGTTVQVIILCSHFFTKQCNIRFVKPYKMVKALKNILKIGFGSSMLELSTVILAIIINNQIMKYGDANDLAVYGMVATVSNLFLSLFSGVGQAIQPIVSANCGAKEKERIKQTWRLSLFTVCIMGVIFTLVGELFPNQLAMMFMDVTPEVLEVAPSVVRPYFTAFLFMGICILSTYHLQSTMQDKLSVTVALLRGLVVSGILLVVLPLFLDILGVWLAIPLAELIVTIIALAFIKKTA